MTASRGDSYIQGGEGGLLPDDEPRVGTGHVTTYPLYHGDGWVLTFPEILFWGVRGVGWR